MKRNAVIALSSNQLSEKEDAIEVLTPGIYLKGDQCYYAEYIETEISGMEGTTTKLEIYPQRISLIREGTTNTKMDFEKNKDNITMYNTPYGALELQIQTKELKVNVNDDGGEVFIDYNMSVAGQKFQKTELRINIKTQH